MIVDPFHQSKWLVRHLDPAPFGQPFNFISKDGHTIVEVKSAITAIRDIQAKTLELAVWLKKAPQVERAAMVILQPRISRNRLAHEWESIQGVISSRLAARLFLVALYPEGPFVQPNDDFCEKMAAVLFETKQTIHEIAVPPGVMATDTFFDVFKLLLNRWLAKVGPISMREVLQHVGCSYPTAAKAVHRLEREQLIARRARRSLELSRFPRSIWLELLALSGTLRRTVYFHDMSARSSGPESLLKRLDRSAPDGVAFGGVVAARHWHPEFNLNGIPRIDLIVHSPASSADLSFISRADPALLRHDRKTERTIVAVHFLQRAIPHFSTAAPYRIPVADPVETLLDLYDLGLAEQMDDLIRHLRSENDSL